MQAIYMIVNTKNNKVYIGKSKNPKQRFIAHKCIPPNERARSDFHKYKKYLRLKILEDFMPEENATSHEKYWILRFKSYEPERGYNVLIGDESAWYAEELRKEYGL